MDLEMQKQLIMSGKMYNESYGRAPEEREAILKLLLKSAGADVHFEPAFRCEFGYNISIGDHFFANFDCVILDVGGIEIGNHVLFGPKTGIYTSNHAIDPWIAQMAPAGQSAGCEQAKKKAPHDGITKSFFYAIEATAKRTL